MAASLTELEVAETLDLSPQGIERTALNALYQGLCRIRTASDDPASIYRLADAMHNLPRALERKDHNLIRLHTIEAVMAELEVRSKQASVEAGVNNKADLVEAPAPDAAKTNLTTQVQTIPKLAQLLRRVTSELEDLNGSIRSDIDDDMADPDGERDMCDATDDLIQEAQLYLASLPADA